MAGQPKRRAILKELERRTRERFDENEAGEHTVLDYVEDYVAAGGTLIALAQSLGTKLGFTVERSTVPNILRKEFGDTESETRLTDARKRASHLLAEESVTLLDTPADSMVDASQLRDRSKARQWLAERWHRDQYGSTKGAAVSISIGSLHLDALRARQAVTALPASTAAHVTMLPAPSSDPATIPDAEVSEV